ncbi:MAG: cysteine desulfurase NifS [Oscillospiraceae bacterium]|nr:cysteine desulfurase NifS [Oscillospiraceae bacterium]
MIYLDNAATTKILPDVLDEMMIYLTEEYGNPSSFYDLGQRSKIAINKARDIIAESIGAKSDEIYFTSCGTESDNWAIRGAAYLGKKQGKNHIISSEFEHHAVLHTLESLKQEGFEITLLPVTSDGFVDLEKLKLEVRDTTCLVTIMLANNEIGTIQPIEKIKKICEEKNILFHTDAVQAVGKIKIDVKELGVDMLSISGHKIHAPKGVGALYIKSGIKLPSYIHGGGQERNKRAGTENVASIVGFGKAVKIAIDKMSENNKYVLNLRNQLIDYILEKIPATKLNGDKQKRLPGNINISFEGIEGESILLMLRKYEICASTGSACTSGSLDPSHVLLSIGLSHEMAHGSIRFTISELNTQEEIDIVKKVLPDIIKKLREMSPIWK